MHWQWMKHGREMMCENAQQIDYFFAFSKLINKKGQILNFKQVLNGDNLQMLARFSHNMMKVRKRFQHHTISAFKFVDGGEKSFCF